MLAPGTRIERYALLLPLADDAPPAGSESWIARAHGDEEGFVVVEVLTASTAYDQALRGRFDARVRRATDLAACPGLVRVLDVGPDSPGPPPFVVTDYVEGETLATCLSTARQRAGAGPGTAAPGVAMRITRELCRTLAGMHGASGVHGKVSPQVVLVSRSADVKLAFGSFASAHDAAAHYAAPEQARREAIGPEADVFAAGAVLFRMLVGRAPHDAGSERATLERLAAGVAVQIPDGASPAVKELLARALAPSPGARFRSAAEMASAIDVVTAYENHGTAELAAWCATHAGARVASRRTRLLELHEQLPSIARTVTAVMPPRTAHAAARRPAEASPDIPASRSDAAVAEEFFDVGVLAARASSPALPNAASRGHVPRAAKAGSLPSAEGVSPPESADGPPLELADMRPAKGPERPPRRVPFLALGVAALLVAGIAFGVALPRMVERRLVSAAQEAGVVLEIDGVDLGLGTTRLRGVTARLASAPTLHLATSLIEVTGFDARVIVVDAPRIHLEGAPERVASELRALERRLRRGRANEPLAGSRRIALPGASVTWEGALGEGSRIAMTEGSADMTVPFASSAPIEGTAHAGRVEVETADLHLGPWSASFEGANVSSRLRLSLDPPVPDGPSILLLRGAGGAGELTVRIARSPLGRIGLRPAELGLPSRPEPEVEATVDGRAMAGGGRVEARGALGVFGVNGGKLGAIDVHVEGRAAGPAGGTLALEKTSVTAGPFTAAVDGTLTPTPHGARLDATFRAEPVPCARFVRAEVKTWGPLAAVLQDIVHEAGVARVTGTAQASGKVSWEPPRGRPVVEVTAKDTCGLSLFGGGG